MQACSDPYADALLRSACADPSAKQTATTRLSPLAFQRAARVAEPDSALLGRLAAKAVDCIRPAQRVLYTWTTDEQIEELTRSPVLLTRTASPLKGRAFFDRRRDQDRSVAARLFDEPALAKRRFAWSNPWATLCGWSDGESYGKRLIRVTLKSGALIAVFDPDARARWRLVDLEGRQVPLGEMIRSPERIAAVYHVFGGDGHTALPFREYVLCNESMIDTWEVGTEQIRADLASDLKLLRCLRADLDRAAVENDPALGRWSFGVAQKAWRGMSPTAAVTPLYEACLAFANDRYQLDPAALDEVIETLATVPTGAPLVHRPNVAFPSFDCQPLGPEAAQPPAVSHTWWPWPFVFDSQPLDPEHKASSTWWPWRLPFIEEKRADARSLAQ